MGRLYRGKRVDNGEWVDGALYQVRNVAYICLTQPTEKYGCGYSQTDGRSLKINHAFRVDPATASQSTGLKDKKTDLNKWTTPELYDGDVVFVLAHYWGDTHIPNQQGTICWEADGWGVSDMDGNFICDLWDYVNNYCGGRIGNIHTDPELLEE